MVETYQQAHERWHGREPVDDAERDARAADFRAVIPQVIAAEVANMRGAEAAGATYVVNGESNLVHRLDCSSIRRLTDRERAWRLYGEEHISTTRHVAGGPFHGGAKMPTQLTRAEVEALPRYDTCSICVPETSTPRKRWQRPGRAT